MKKEKKQGYETAGAVEQIPVADILPNPQQPRKSFDREKLLELSESIAENGILQPLIVTMRDGRPVLLAGERRLRAAKIAGLRTVPCVLREADDMRQALLALIENLQREDLNPMEEALGYQKLMESYGLTQEETAHIVNKSRPAVANALRLLNLPAEVTAMVAEGTLSAGHARAILAFAPEMQVETAKSAVKSGASVRELERQARAAQREKKTPRATAFRRDSFYDEVELALSEALSRKVRVTVGEKSGTLALEFYDREDLQELANRLSK